MKSLVMAAGALLSGMVAANCDFDCSLNKHLQAIADKDWSAFEQTLSRETLPFILPNGKRSMSAERYRETLEPWFADKSWRFQAKELYRNVGADLGMVLLDVDYDEPERDGKPYHLDHYLTLVFAKEGQQWKLVFDQNTAYQPVAEER